MHVYYSGTWGAHRGRYVARHGKGAVVSRRRVFQSLAISDSTSTKHATRVSVPRITYFERVLEREAGEEDFGMETITVEEEKEVEVDVVDLLSECPPKEDWMMANLSSERYRFVPRRMARHNEDLSGIFIPTSRLVGLMQVIQAVHTGPTTHCKMGCDDREAR